MLVVVYERGGRSLADGNRSGLFRGRGRLVETRRRCAASRRVGFRRPDAGTPVGCDKGGGRRCGAPDVSRNDRHGRNSRTSAGRNAQCADRGRSGFYDSFGVSAYAYSGDWNEQCKPNLMYNVRVSRNAVSNRWVPDGRRYFWPKTKSGFGSSHMRPTVFRRVQDSCRRPMTEVFRKFATGFPLT